MQVGCVDGVSWEPAYSVGRVWRLTILSGFKPSRRTVSQAAGGPHSSRNFWQPQVVIFD